MHVERSGDDTLVASIKVPGSSFPVQKLQLLSAWGGSNRLSAAETIMWRMEPFPSASSTAGIPCRRPVARVARRSQFSVK